MRTAIVGDIGGQIDVFHDVIRNLDGDIETGLFPEDLRVIQVGDIVRMNPSPDLDSVACAKLADKLLHANKGRYIQLLGNHETPLLGGVVHPGWSITDIPEARPIIERWWNKKQAHLAVVLHADGEKDILITHAGLTRGYMTDFLNTRNVRDAVSQLNRNVGNIDLRSMECPGGLVGGPDNESADIFWSLCGPELHASWWGNPMGFNQIHGHACIFRWDTEQFFSDLPDEIRKSTIVNKESRFTITQHPDGDWFRSVDWVLQNTKKRQEWPVLVLDGFDIYLGE